MIFQKMSPRTQHNYLQQNHWGTPPTFHGKRPWGEVAVTFEMKKDLFRIRFI